MSSEYSVEDLQIARMAREYRGEIMAVGATLLSMLAARLAKYTADDDLIIQGGDSWACWDSSVVPYLEHEEYIARGSAQGQFEWSLTFDFVQSGRFKIFTSPAQVDRFGNANLSVVGDWNKPAVQMIGSRGLPDDLWRIPQLDFHVPNHTKRSLVDRVDFVSSFGNGETRQALNCKTGRPGTLVSNLGVFSWPADSEGQMRVESLHPGVTPDQVRDATGFEIEIPKDVPTTAAPTDLELEALRTVVDPWDYRHGGGGQNPSRTSLLVARGLASSFGGRAR